MRGLMIAGGILGGLGVILGAWGAHGLEDVLVKWYPDEVSKKLANWQTAVAYQMYHAVALVALGGSSGDGKKGKFAAGTCWILGVLIFSGMLYALVLSNVKILGAIVPVGGVAMIGGWAWLAIAAIRMSPSRLPEDSRN